MNNEEIENTINLRQAKDKETLLNNIWQRFANNPNEKFLLMILCSQAKLENDNKSLNVKRSIRQSASTTNAWTDEPRNPGIRFHKITQMRIMWIRNISLREI